MKIQPHRGLESIGQKKCRKNIICHGVNAGELAFDGACVAVRVAAVTGLAVLAQNPLTQPLMKVMLPTLRPLMWDSALAVRIALADMLLAIGYVVCPLCRVRICTICIACEFPNLEYEAGSATCLSLGLVLAKLQNDWDNQTIGSTGCQTRQSIPADLHA